MESNGRNGEPQPLGAGSRAWPRIFLTVPAAEVPGPGRPVLPGLVHHRCVCSALMHPQAIKRTLAPRGNPRKALNVQDAPQCSREGACVGPLGAGRGPGQQYHHLRPSATEAFILTGPEPEQFQTRIPADSDPGEALVPACRWHLSLCPHMEERVLVSLLLIRALIPSDLPLALPARSSWDLITFQAHLQTPPHWG